MLRRGRSQRKQTRRRSNWQRRSFLLISLITLAFLWIVLILWFTFYFDIPHKQQQQQPAIADITQSTDNTNSPLAKQTKKPIPQRQQNNEESFPSNTLPKYMSPLLIFTCKRANYLNRTLWEVFERLPQTCEIGCPVIVSQDGSDRDVASVIRKYQKQYQDAIPLIHIQHTQRNIRINAYQALAIHYGWALKKLFDGLSGEYPLPERVIILEEDLHIASDFFQYFESMAPILDADDSLFAVSAFNDNGKEGLVADYRRIMRSDFFPGLGWMMTRKLWDLELSSKWPNGYWDDWLRDPAQRQGRHVLRPEVSRTFHFGTHGGASQNQFGTHHQKILLNRNPVDWRSVDLTQLQEAEYDHHYYNLIASANLASSVSDALLTVKTANTKIEYRTWKEFQGFASQLNLMKDEKAGIPRSSYRGVVETRPFGRHILFLVPIGSKLTNNFVHRKSL